MTTKNEAIANADAHLNDAGFATYTELQGLLREADLLALDLFVGNAYIRRSYVDKQDALRSRIRRALSSAK